MLIWFIFFIWDPGAPNLCACRQILDIWRDQKIMEEKVDFLL